MREYYARLFGEARQRVFIFWKAQIGVSLGAGIIAAAVNAIRQQTPLGVTFWSVGIAIVGYFIILAVFSIFALMCAPVSLDRKRVGEIDTLSTTLKSQQEAMESLRLTTARDPAKEHHYQQAKDGLTKVSAQARGLLKHLWTVGQIKAHPKDIKALGMTHLDTQTAFEQLRSADLVTVETGYQNGAYEIWSVSPGFKDVLGQLLF